MPAPQLHDLLPEGSWREDSAFGGDLARFVDRVLQPVLDLLGEDADRFGRQVDPDLADPNAVAAMLLDLGCPFPAAFSLSVQQQRRLVKSLLRIYKQIGTGPAIVELVRALTGLSVVRIQSPAIIRGWILGERVLGDAPPTPIVDPETTDFAILADPASQAWTFQLAIAGTLSQEQLELVAEVVRQAKPAHSHYFGVIQP